MDFPFTLWLIRIPFLQEIKTEQNICKLFENQGLEMKIREQRQTNVLAFGGDI